MTGSLFMVSLFTVCLGITTLALYLATVSVYDNVFQTGSIKINLNDGNPIIEEHEFLFKPGMSVTKEFFIENKGTWDVYYKLYFDQTEGGLANVLEVTVHHGDDVLYHGLASEFNKKNVDAVSQVLKLNEKQDLTMTFYYPEASSNETQNLSLTFNLCADAVQTKNNPNKEF